MGEEKEDGEEDDPSEEPPNQLFRPATLGDRRPPLLPGALRDRCSPSSHRAVEVDDPRGHYHVSLWWGRRCRGLWIFLRFPIDIVCCRRCKGTTFTQFTD